ncbi:MAG: apolipoprotein N-acyltransferase, partial [Actinomycetota bacterium]|nr:apolipoprotein N-acyltransferase [Actinomycetota bacterium]
MKSASAIAVAALSGLALNLAFPEPDLFWVAWLAIAPLLYVLKGAGPKRGFILGLAFGITFFGALLSWVSIVGWIAWLLLVLMEAAFFGAFGLVWGASSGGRGAVARVAIPALLWVALEYLRSVVPVVGFTWGELAQTQHNFPFFLKTAGIGGGWLVAALLVLVNALLLEVVLAVRERSWKPCIASVALLLAVAAAPVLVHAPSADGPSLRVAIVQGNVPDTEPSFEKDLLIVESHVALTKELAGRPIDLVVWPESSVGIDPFRNPDVAASM